MPPLPGEKLGPYEIVALLGAGGMGEVYRARDTRLGRDVALKVSAERFSERFEREARAIASLNHPNVCTLHDVGPNYLVMELVEGHTLSERIKEGAIPLEEALAIAKQIAAALEAAHEKGITHRDLKPGNIILKSDGGTVKVLDFGLAKIGGTPTAQSEHSPTITMGATQAGVILGTAAYMAPEQARGKDVDKRADIWAFGVVLHEMLTGQRLFQGEDLTETLASVVKEKPDLSGVPEKVRRLIERCLEKDPRKRLRDIGDMDLLLGVSQPALPQQIPPKPAWRIWLLRSMAALLLIAVSAALAWILKPSAPVTITRFPFTLGEGQVLTSSNFSNLAVSPDGTQMVYVANSRLYLRSMAELEARPIPGTDSEVAVTNPVYSPDGKSLAYFSGSDRSIKRIAVSGGAAVTLCPVGGLATTGISWSEEGILFSNIKGILRVSANGGKPEPLVIAKENELMAGPQMLPGGQSVLFALATGGGAVLATDWDKAQIVVQTLKSGARKVVVEGGSDARYLPSGHLAYALRGVLFAVPFNVGRLETTGGPVGVVEGIARGLSGAAQFAVSNTGSLIYIPGPVTGGGAGQGVLALVDRKGAVEPLKVPPGSYGSPRVSRDGKRVAYQADDSKESSIWIYELSGATAPRRLTLPGTGSNLDPIWSADGEHVAFQSDREGDLGIWWQRADGNGAAERLTKPDKGVSHIPDSWSPDGQVFSFTEEKGSASAIWTYSLRDKKAALFAETAGSPLGRSVFSPDGHWIAYQLAGTGNSRLYVRPFPPTQAAYVAPEDRDSHHPLWTPDGKELFYIPGGGQLGSFSITTKPSVSFGTPVRAPRSGFMTQASPGIRTYDILPDGKRFIGQVSVAQAQSGPASAPQIQVVLNWFEEVKQRATAH